MKDFIKDFSIYGIASTIGKIAAVLLIPVYTNILTKEEYGAMALITACKGFIDVLSNLNIHSGIAREFYEVGDNRKHLVSTGLYSILGFSVITLLITILCSNYITDNLLGIPKFYNAFIVMAISIPAGSVMSYFTILTRFKKKPIQFAIGNLIQLGIQIIISIIGVVYLNKGIISVFAGILCGEVFSIVYFGYINRELLGVYFENKYLKKSLLFSIPTLPAILAGWIDSSLGQVVVGKYISIEELGVYSLAVSLSSVFIILSTAFQNVWNPYLYENYKTASFSRETSNIFSAFVIVLVIITFSVSLLAPEFVRLISNSTYSNAAIYLPLLCVPMSFYLLFPIASSGVSISRKTKFLGFAYVIGSLLNVVTLTCWISFMGIYAVPLSLSVSRIYTFIYLYKTSNNLMKMQLPIKVLFIIPVIAMFCSIMNYYQCSFMSRMIIYIITTFIILYILESKYSAFSKIKSRINRF